MSTPPIKVDKGPTCLRIAAVQMIFADSLTGNLEKIERACKSFCVSACGNEVC